MSQASPSTRRLLLDKCDVLEIWELPGKVFTDAALQPMVIFAQHKPDDQAGRLFPMPVRVRNVQCNTLENFRQEGSFTAAGIAISQAEWGSDSRLGPKTTHAMRYYLILSHNQWTEIQQRTCRLDEVADITPGAIEGSRSRWRWSDYPQPKRVNWLPGAKKSMPRPYYTRYGDDTRLYPNEFEEPRKNRRYPHLDREYLLAGPKVLLVSDPNPSWGQRVKLAIERRGYYPSDSFWVLASKREQAQYISLEVLAAVVSWYVGNAWIVEHLKAPKIYGFALKSIPFPHELSAADRKELESAVHRLEVAAADDHDDPDAQRTIDQVLKAAYQLDDATFERLRMVAGWERVDPAVFRKRRPNPAELVFVTGGVEEIDPKDGTITLWLNGLVGLHTTPITDEMPGWMLRPGVAFRARISEEGYRQQSLDGVVWESIAPQEYTYLTEDELLDRLDVSLSETSNLIDIAGS